MTGRGIHGSLGGKQGGDLMPPWALGLRSEVCLGHLAHSPELWGLGLL